MHAGIIVYDNIDRQSGGYLYDRKLVESLRTNGHQVTVYTQRQRAYGLQWIENWTRSLWSQLSKESLDILIQDELNHFSLFLGNRWLRREVDYPIVSVVHHLRSREERSRIETRMCRWIEQSYLRTVDGCIFNSQTTRRSVKALVDVASSVVAPPSGRRFGDPLPRAQIRDRAHESGALRVLFVGNVVPRKNVCTLIECLTPLKEAWHLDVAGDLSADASYAASVRRTIDDRNLDDRVRLHDSVSDDDLRELLASSHVLAVPSTYEGYGIVYVEGMGYGLPCVATSRGGASEFVRDGVNGFLVDPDDHQLMTQRLELLATDRHRLETMGLAARDTYQRLPTWDDTGAAVTAFLERLVSS